MKEQRKTKTDETVAPGTVKIDQTDGAKAKVFREVSLPLAALTALVFAALGFAVGRSSAFR